MPKLTKKIIDALECDGTKPVFLWDANLAGFGIKALPSGAKKYVVKYRSNGGGRNASQRWVTLGGHGQLTCDQARDLAQQILAAVARGEDPQSDKFKRRNAPTLNDAWQRFEADYLPQRKPKTQQEYQRQWRDVIAPVLGRMQVADVNRSDMAKLHKSMSSAPYRANRVLALCSRLMSLTEAWEWRPQGTNPCRYVEKYKEQPRNRYLGANELRLLGEALRDLAADRHIQPAAANAIKLLLLTGARLNEILTAQWEWVDWDKRILALPDSKTGQKPIYLSDAAIVILQVQLEEIKAKANKSSSTPISPDYIFPGRSAGKHMINLRKPWERVCKYAGIEGVRLHDLRHTAASIAVGQGASLPIIGRLLGHSQAQTTLRYAHVDADPALVAANLIGEAVDKAMG